MNMSMKTFFVAGTMFAVAAGDAARAQERAQCPFSACSVSANHQASRSDTSRSVPASLFGSAAARTSPLSSEVLGAVVFWQLSDRRSEPALAQRPGTLRIDEDVNSPRALPRTYWLEGGITGGIGLGLVAAVLYGALCLEESQSCTGSTIGGAVFGGGLGFTVGALVGGQFHKAGTDTVPPP